MTRYQLENELILGLPAIDEDHRRLVEVLNRLADAVAADPAADAVIDCLIGLADLACTHFGKEEELMESIGFPGRLTHAGTHKGSLVQLKVLTDVITDGTMEADPNVVEFLANWLFDHICSLDRELAAFASAWADGHTLPRAVNS